MAEAAQNDLLAQLAAPAAADGGAAAWAALAASEPQHDADPPEEDKELDALLSRIQQLQAGGNAAAAAASPDTAQAPPATAKKSPDAPQNLRNGFVPVEPPSLRAAELSDSEVEALVLKFLLARGDASGRDIAEQVKLPFVLIDPVLRELKNQQLLCHRGAAAMNDFQYQLTDVGRERGRRYSQHCTYFGAAPVSLRDYIRSVQQQSLTNQHPTDIELHRAFEDLLLNKRMLDRLGPAINSGRGLFLFGAPGNGKTSIAERITSCFGAEIWIPRAIGIDGEVIRLYDPVNHEEVPLSSGGGLLDERQVDKRWIRVRRPTIIAGGELTMSQLEVTINTSTGISEAPLQLKSNCGTLVIDDFGRQRMRIDELLNRWIVPLEKRYDFLNLPNGKKIKVPFDQLIIFSTNLEPKQLVDEAFLRRIPYKVEAIDPTEEEFRELFKLFAPKLDMAYQPAAVDYLINRHYKGANRPFRFCQPRDLLLQVRNYCIYHDRPAEMTDEYFDRAVENYFAVM